jgi:hypothetical protein
VGAARAVFKSVAERMMKVAEKRMMSLVTGGFVIEKNFVAPEDSVWIMYLDF